MRMVRQLDQEDNKEIQLISLDNKTLTCRKKYVAATQIIEMSLFSTQFICLFVNTYC